jgi:hypothetical protein
VIINLFTSPVRTTSGNFVEFCCAGRMKLNWLDCAIGDSLVAMGAFSGLTESVSIYLGWPAWALSIIAVLSLIIAALSIVQTISASSVAVDAKHAKSSKKTTEFRWFQLQYLGVYLIIMLADWLQGTNMYTLYSVGNQQCSAL